MGDPSRRPQDPRGHGRPARHRRREPRTIPVGASRLRQLLVADGAVGPPAALRAAVARPRRSRCLPCLRPWAGRRPWTSTTSWGTTTTWWHSAQPRPPPPTARAPSGSTRRSSTSRTGRRPRSGGWRRTTQPSTPSWTHSPAERTEPARRSGRFPPGTRRPSERLQDHVVDDLLEEGHVDRHRDEGGGAYLRHNGGDLLAGTRPRLRLDRLGSEPRQPLHPGRAVDDEHHHYQRVGRDQPAGEEVERAGEGSEHAEPHPGDQERRPQHWASPDEAADGGQPVDVPLPDRAGIEEGLADEEGGRGEHRQYVQRLEDEHDVDPLVGHEV